MGKKLKKKKQSGILPYRVEGNRVEILLITTRSGNNWTIPKGSVISKKGDLKSAIKEGWEEAGITGYVHESHIGNFQIEKGKTLYSVKVFLCKVNDLSSLFPERELRKRKWVSMKDAVGMVKHDGLKKLLTDLDEIILAMTGT